MVQILAPFLLLSAFSGTCLSISHPVKRTAAQVEADLVPMAKHSADLTNGLKNFDGSSAQGEVGFGVSFRYILQL
jgi:hypothetical protein